MTTRGILVPKHRLERLTLTLEPFRPLFQALAQRDPLEAASLLNTRPFGEHGPSLGDLAVLAATETAMAIREAEAGPTRRTLPLPEAGTTSVSWDDCCRALEVAAGSEPYVLVSLEGLPVREVLARNEWHAQAIARKHDRLECVVRRGEGGRLELRAKRRLP